ncbi:MAG: GMP synthase, partial [Calditrichaeota bacterium]
QGMGLLQRIVNEAREKYNQLNIQLTIFDTRYKAEVPDLTYDIYISSGGPGSPFDGIHSLWEKKYFHLMESIWENNLQENRSRKFVFFICHSFQLMCRVFNLAEVRKRNFRSFGILPVVKTEEGMIDPLFQPLPEVFYAADFREFEVVSPNMKRLNELGGKILALESERIDPSWERALMAIRLSDEIVGTQFHPEADPESMKYHFQHPERKEQVVKEYGISKYEEMLELLENPEPLLLTQRTILPGFLNQAIQALTNSVEIQSKLENEKLRL